MKECACAGSAGQQAWFKERVTSSPLASRKMGVGGTETLSQLRGLEDKAHKCSPLVILELRRINGC